LFYIKNSVAEKEGYKRALLFA